ncbi:MAG TPA: Rieske (2Fe-2S) protein [Ignavibacteria bacterium]
MIENLNLEKKQSRRDFLNYVLGIGIFGWLAATIYPLYLYLKPPKAPEVDVKNVKLGNVNEIEKNSSKMFKFGNKPGILVRTAEGDFRAFNATCTHLDCTVQYKKEEGLIWCACHNGRYDLNGKNVSGPPPRPLTPISITIQKDEIFVST